MTVEKNSCFLPPLLASLSSSCISPLDGASDSLVPRTAQLTTCTIAAAPDSSVFDRSRSPRPLYRRRIATIVGGFRILSRSMSQPSTLYMRIIRKMRPGRGFGVGKIRRVSLLSQTIIIRWKYILVRNKEIIPRHKEFSKVNNTTYIKYSNSE